MTRNWLAAYTKARHETAVARQLEAKEVTFLLPTYSWPGNIREMRNVLERAAQIAPSPVLTVRDLELQYSASPTGNRNGHHRLSQNHFTLREMETHYIEAVLHEEEGSIDRAARRLGISRSSLYNKVRSKEVERLTGHAQALLQ